MRADPVFLKWANFQQAGHQLYARVSKPPYQVPVEALTAFDYNVPPLPPRQVANGQLALAETFEITITPNAQLSPGANQTPDLLSHEQLHYDVATVTGRQLARELMQLRKPTAQQLGAEMRRLVDLHFTKRAGLISRRYDDDTRNNAIPRYQTLWKTMMTDCLSHPDRTYIDGFRL